MASLPTGSERPSASQDLAQDIPDLSLSPPRCQSTPQKKKLVCPYCDKQYSVKFYYDRHIESHLPASNPPDAPSNISLALELNDSAVSVAQSSFRIPDVPKKKKVVTKKPKPKPNYTCTYCLKGYICQRSFKTHVRTHRVQDAASHYPDKEKFIENCDRLATDALTKVSNAPSCGVGGILFRQLVGHIISLPKEAWKIFSEQVCEELVEEVLKKKVLLPSSLLPAIFTKVECLLSNREMCIKFLQYLNIPNDLSGNLADQFLLEFILHFAQVCLSFTCDTFREGRTTILVTKPVELDADDRQVIYYIGGSVMRGYIRMAYRYKNTKSWQHIADVIKTKVLRDKPSEGDIDYVDAGWVMARDRGGLLYIVSDAKEFFISLTQVVFASEQKDGSINYEEVIRKVSICPIVDYWDAVIGDALNESTSLNLMNDVIRSFCRTCLSGFAKRRLNFLKEKPVISMPTRHLVASRKKK